MSKQSRREFLKLAGATAATLATGSALASENPFAFKKMASGYEQVAMEGKCGEGKCGGSKMGEGKGGEGKCGGSKMGEGKCGEGKCGGSKMGEGKCGGGHS